MDVGHGKAWPSPWPSTLGQDVDQIESQVAAVLTKVLQPRLAGVVRS